jgi:Carboxypeptidase regulatory-like domain
LKRFPCVCRVMSQSKRAAMAVVVLGLLGVLLPAVTALGDESGAQVSGTVTQVGTGKPLENVTVCVQAVAPAESEVCAASDADGNYAITGIPSGTYLVAFGVEALPGGGRTAGQWWNGASVPAQATPITMAPPQIFTGVNAQLGTTAAGSKPHNGGGTIVVPGTDQQPPPELIPQRCKKGYRWRKVHGVKRCVPKPRHHHSHRR